MGSCGTFWHILVPFGTFWSFLVFLGYSLLLFGIFGTRNRDMCYTVTCRISLDNKRRRKT